MNIFKALIPNQFYFFQTIWGKLKKFFTLYYRAAVDDIARLRIKTSYLYSRLTYKNLASDISDNRILSETKFNTESVKISFCAATRKINNPNCRLDKFIESVLKTVKDSSSVEILVAIDQDDDIDYFRTLHAKYSDKLILKIFVSSVRHGYQKLHLYDKDLYRKISPSSKMICDYSDDCIITLEHFDEKLLEIDGLYSDNIYFIHTRVTKRHEYLGDVKDNILLLYWILQAREPASYFPIFSRKVLDIAFEYAAKHDPNGEWSPVANAWICDCYIDILSVYVSQLGLDRIHFIDMILMNPDTILSQHQRNLTEHKLTPNNLGFIKMLRNDTQTYLQNLAREIAEHDATKITS